MAFHYGAKKLNDVVDITPDANTSSLGTTIRLTQGVGEGTIDVPYASPYPYMANPLFNDNLLPTLGPVDVTASALGFCAIYVNSKLQGPIPNTVSASVEVNVFVSALPNSFSVHYPVHAGSYRFASYYNSPPSVNPAETTETGVAHSAQEGVAHAAHDVVQGFGRIHQEQIEQNSAGDVQSFSHVDHFDEKDWAMSDVLKKPFRLATVDWTTQQPKGAQLVAFDFPTSIFASNELLRWALRRFTFFQCDGLELRVETNSSPMNAGKVLITYVPGSLQGGIAKFFDIESLYTQRHVMLDATSGTVASLTIPWISSLGALYCEDIVDGESFGSMKTTRNHLGAILTVVFNPLTDGTDAQNETVNLLFTASFINPRLSVPRAVNTVPVTEASGRAHSSAEVVADMAAVEDHTTNASNNGPVVQVLRDSSSVSRNTLHFGEGSADLRDLLRRRTQVGFVVVPPTAGVQRVSIRPFLAEWQAYVAGGSMFRAYRGSIQLGIGIVQRSGNAQVFHINVEPPDNPFTGAAVARVPYINPSNQLAEKIIDRGNPFVQFEVPFLSSEHIAWFDAPAPTPAIAPPAENNDWILSIYNHGDSTDSHEFVIYISAGDDFRFGVYAGAPRMVTVPLPWQSSYLNPLAFPALFNSNSVIFNQSFT